MASGVARKDHTLEPFCYHECWGLGQGFRFMNVTNKESDVARDGKEKAAEFIKTIVRSE